MNVQSDCESLYINCIEEYKKKYSIDDEKVYELFHEYHIFENVLLQHEYLHQVSFEEVFQYIEILIKQDSKKITVYHGSCFKFDQIDLNKSHNRRDFGKGFYTTVLMSQSKEWAYRLSLREKKNNYYVYEYLFEKKDDLNIKYFDSLNEEWLEFIKENRIKGGLQHQYDVVIGPVADDNTMQTVQLYMSNILTAPEAVEKLKYSKVNNQVSFHSEKSLSCLRFIRRMKYDA